MDFINIVINSMENAEDMYKDNKRKKGGSKKHFVMAMVKDIVVEMWGEEIWKTKYKFLTANIIELLVMFSKNELVIHINEQFKKNGCLPVCWKK